VVYIRVWKRYTQGVPTVVYTPGGYTQGAPTVVYIHQGGIPRGYNSGIYTRVVYPGWCICLLPYYPVPWWVSPLPYYPGTMVGIHLLVYTPPYYSRVHPVPLLLMTDAADPGNGDG